MSTTSPDNTTRVNSGGKHRNSTANSEKTVALTQKAGNPTKADRRAPYGRRPVIKTMTNNDRVYKNVTFTERRNLMPLQIKMPTNYKKSKTKDLSRRLSISSRSSIKEKRSEGRTNMDGSVSPQLAAKICSPPTEVAKWSRNNHANLYYEAWVDTALAAVSKASTEEKNTYIKAIRKALARRPPTPDLVYTNLNDERYTGRIKVMQR